MNCHDHGAVDAVVYCGPCGVGWCKPCSIRGNVVIPVCRRCGVKLGPLPRTGNGADASDLAGRLFSRESVLTAAILGVLGLVAGFMSGGFGPGGILVWAVYLGIVVAYYFSVIEHVGGGRPGMPGPADDAFDFLSLFSHALRGAACFGVGFAPLLVWLFGFHHWRTLETERGTAWLLVMIGQLYTPAVLLAVTFGKHTANAFWPPAWIQIIARAPGSYFWFSLLWLVTIFVVGALVGAGQEVASSIPLAGTAIAATLGSLFWFAQAILVGLFIRRNADAFGWS